MKNLNSRIKKVRECFCNDSNTDFAKALEVSVQYASNITKDGKSVGDKTLSKILEVFPNINPVWLKMGEGVMLRDGEDAAQQSSGGKVVPLYDTTAMAGSGADMQAVAKPVGMVNVGDYLTDSEAAMGVFGNSMLPGYPPGSLIGLRRCYDNFIKQGEVYVIETTSDRFLKRIYMSDDKKCIVCLSDNPAKHHSGAYEGRYCYPPFEIPLEEIKSLWFVTGVIKRNSSGGIIQRVV